MNNSKRNKIQAKLDCPATPEPEREVCRKILKENPKQEPEHSPLDGMLHTMQTPRSQASGDFWQQARNQQQAAAQAQQWAAAEAQARQQAQQKSYSDLFGVLLGGIGGAGVFGSFGNIFNANKKKPCEQCGNQFYVVTEKDLYCPICLAAKRKEAEK